MEEEDLNHYIKEIIDLIKDNAKKAKLDADNPQKNSSSDYATGFLMAYYQIISMMKNQASVFDLEQEEIGLADIEPERDLL